MRLRRLRSRARVHLRQPQERLLWFAETHAGRRIQKIREMPCQRRRIQEESSLRFPFFEFNDRSFTNFGNNFEFVDQALDPWQTQTQAPRCRETILPRKFDVVKPGTL